MLMVAALAACAPSVDTFVSVADDDPDVNAAIGQARASLPHFWEVFAAPARGESDFSLKVRITDGGAVEHFWVTDLQREAGKVHGLIGNDPRTVSSVAFGDRIEVPASDVTDWMYMRDGKMVGNFTLRPLLKQMPAADVERIKSMMADLP